MLPVRLELYNFLAYRGPVSVPFEGIDLAGLSGPNGAGKSSLLDGITWALWGASRLGKTGDDSLVHLGQHSMYVIFDFRQDNQLYRVKREHIRKARASTGSLHLLVWNDDHEEWRSLAEGKSDAQVRINQLLRLDYQTFVDSAFIQQGKADSFTIKTAKERKQLLADILGLDRWAAYDSQVKAKLEDIENQISVIQGIIQERSTETEQEADFIQRVEETTAKSHALAQRLDDARAHYEEIANAANDHKRVQTELNNSQKRLVEYRTGLHQTEQALQQVAARIEQYQTVLASRDDIEQGYATLLEARQVHEQLNETYRQQTNVEHYLNKLLRQLDAVEQGLTAELTQYAERVRVAQASLANAEKVQAQLTQLEQQLADLEQAKVAREQVQANISTMYAEKSGLEATNAALSAQMNELEPRLKILKQAATALCPVCAEPLSEDRRHQLIEQYSQQGTQLGDLYRSHKQHIKVLERDIKAEQDTLSQQATRLAHYDKLTRQQGTYHHQLDQAQQAQADLQTAQAAHEALHQQITAGDFGHELRAEMVQYQQQIAELGYDEAYHKQVRAAIKHYESYEQLHQALQAALNSFLDAQANRDTKSADLLRWQEMLRSEEDIANRYAEELTQLKGLIKEADQRRQVMQLAQRQLQEAEQARTWAEQNLKAVHDARKRAEDLQRQLVTLREEETLLNTLREAFGRNGIPAMLIEAAIPELEVMTNLLLQRMTDGRMHIRFDTQKLNKSGTVAETLDILISDELGQRSYELYSGGEAFRINFALRIALSQFLARRAGARLQTLVIDEGFGSQDAMGRERIVDAINAISDDFDMILIVTHIDEFLDMFPHRIEVRKLPEQGSQVFVR